MYLPQRVIAARGDSIPVVGRVSLWGVVHEHEHGWRASCAYPISLFVPVVVDDDWVEKVIAANSRGLINLRPLQPGRYKFFDDFHPETQGTLVVP